MVVPNLKGLIALSVAAKMVPSRSGKGVSICTLWRWTTRGVRGQVLWSTLVGGTRFTSIAAIEQFIAATNRVKESTGDGVSLQHVDDDAEQKLKSAGVLS